MGQAGAAQHPMKMGVRRKRAFAALFGESADAMNMAWTVTFTSTMVAALSNANPRRKVIP
jgi:hypothetical protein